MKYPISKYKIVKCTHPETKSPQIVAISTYAGKWVKGRATCHSDDTFNEEKGTELAVARCAHSVAKKRRAYAREKMNKAALHLLEAQKYYEKMNLYYADACAEVEEAATDVSAILAEM
jgi:hypothetical protein